MTTSAHQQDILRHQEPQPEQPVRIDAGHVVSLHYFLPRGDGTLIDACAGDPPFEYLHGAGNVVAGLERGLTGHVAGDRLSVQVPPELGYGLRRPDLVHRVPRSAFPKDVEVRRGLRFGSSVGDVVLPAWVVAVDGKDAIVSFHHPLAGVTLHFEVAVLGVRAARSAELVRGRPLPARRERGAK